MNQWLENIKIKNNKKAIPILGFPAVSLLNCSVNELVHSSKLQVEALRRITEECDPLAVLGFMDLSVEAECFGAEIRFNENEVPTVLGSLIEEEEDLETLHIPEVGEGRTNVYLQTMRDIKQIVKDRPVFAGCIGPYSLAGRLLDVSEAMILCYEDPDLVEEVLDIVTDFLIKYLNAYKETGVDGVLMAEPLAGILSPKLNKEFSIPYVKKIVDRVQDENFIILYHNCGNNTLLMINDILTTGCKGYHFGNAIDMKEMIKKIPDDVLVMGNIDPVHMKDATREQVIEETKDLLQAIGNKDNFIISSGCDIPPGSSWDNIHAFMFAAKEFYQE